MVGRSAAPLTVTQPSLPSFLALAKWAEGEDVTCHEDTIIYIHVYIRLYTYYINNHTCLHRIGKQRSENHVPSGASGGDRGRPGATGGDRRRPGATWAAAPAPSHGWDFWRSPHWGLQGGLKPLPPRIQIWKWGGYHGVPMKAIEIMG